MMTVKGVVIVVVVVAVVAVVTVTRLKIVPWDLK